MGTDGYLEWLGGNLELALEMTSLEIEFQLYLSRTRLWQAGFAYYEPHEGMYPLEYLSGKGETAEEALGKAVEKGRPIFDLLTVVKGKVGRPLPLEPGRQYALIRLDIDGIAYVKVTNLGNDSTWIKLRCDDTGHTMKLRLKLSRLIFNIPPPGIEKQLLGSAQ